MAHCGNGGLSSWYFEVSGTERDLKVGPFRMLVF